MPKVSLGRTVHFVNLGQHFTALVSKVNENESVTLHVCNPDAEDVADAIWIVKDVRYDATFSEGTWHWPEQIQ